MATINADIERRIGHSIDGEDDASKRGRARVSRACTRCRTRKDKCDARQPQCSACEAAKQVCHYVAPTKKRGLPEGYVRGMEKLWAIMMQKVGGLEDVVAKVMEDNMDDLLEMWNHHRHGDQLHHVWKESKILQELEGLLSQLDQTSSDLKRKRERDDESEDGDSSNGMNVSARQLSTDFQIAPKDAPNSALLTGTSQYTTSELADSQPSLPSTASALLDHYFTHTHSWFPILDRPYTLRKFYESSKSLPNTSIQSADLAFLWAICALASQQTVQGIRSPTSRSIDSSVEQMRQIARRLIPPETGPFSLGHVQALLILALLDVGLSKWASAWILVGKATRIFLTSLTQAFPSRSVKATLQGCFILDTLIALRLKQTPHLRKAHLSSSGLSEEDGHEEWEPWNANAGQPPYSREPAFSISCFNRLTELCMVLNEIHSTVYPSEAARLASVQTWPPKLQTLSQQYPFRLSSIEQRLPHQLNLQLYHLGTLALISHELSESWSESMQRFLEVLESFSAFTTLHAPCGVPPITAGICHAIAQIAEEQQPLGYLAQSETQARNVFRRRLHQVLSSLGLVWPAFNEPAALLEPRSAGPIPSTLGAPPRQHAGLQSGSTSINSPGSSTWPAEALHASQHPLLASGHAPPGGQMDLQYRQGASPMAAGARHPGLQPAMGSYRSMSIDVPEDGGVGGSGLSTALRKAGSIGGAAMSSPSFNGDEIDALFHEMAQLDTTQWTLGRSQGLRDFGFADDSTFEAFCNDPDRLMLSDGYMAPFGSAQMGAEASAPLEGSEGMKQNAGTASGASIEGQRDPFQFFDHSWERS